MMVPVADSTPSSALEQPETKTMTERKDAKIRVSFITQSLIGDSRGGRAPAAKKVLFHTQKFGTDTLGAGQTIGLLKIVVKHILEEEGVGNQSPH